MLAQIFCFGLLADFLVKIGRANYVITRVGKLRKRKKENGIATKRVKAEKREKG